jgi:hypothetical protein
MTTSAGASEERAGRSADELYAWAARRLHSGVSTARLAFGLVERGLPAPMAAYLARHIAHETYPQRRAKAWRLTLEGIGWLAGSAAAFTVVHTAGGTWPAPGPAILGWAVVGCGILRVAGGILTLPRRSDSRRLESRTAGSAAADGDVPALLDFQTLGLQPDAPLAAIQQSYRELARIWHPDRFADSAEMRSRAELRMKRINAAYARLSQRALEQPS